MRLLVADWLFFIRCSSPTSSLQWPAPWLWRAVAARTVLSLRFTAGLDFCYNPSAGLRLRAWFWTSERRRTRYSSYLHGWSLFDGIFSLIQFQALLSVVAMVWVACARMARNRRFGLLQEFLLSVSFAGVLTYKSINSPTTVLADTEEHISSCFQRSLTVRISAHTWPWSMYNVSNSKI